MNDLDPTYVLSNRVEAGLWVAIGVGCAVAAVARPGTRRDAVAAAVAFLAFGASDVVESYTGAWWRPWWLLAWKAACVLALLVLLARHVKRRRAGSPPERSP